LSKDIYCSSSFIYNLKISISGYSEGEGYSIKNEADGFDPSLSERPGPLERRLRGGGHCVVGLVAFAFTSLSQCLVLDLFSRFLQSCSDRLKCVI